MGTDDAAADPIEQIGRTIWHYRFNLYQAEWINALGWPLADGSRVVLPFEELDRAFARSIEIRGREGPPKRGEERGGPRLVPRDQ